MTGEAADGSAGVPLANDSSGDTQTLAAVSPISGSRSRLLFRHEVLRKYEAEYYYDEEIGYIFVREPHWLDEAYSEAISLLDTGILARNLANIDTVSHWLLENGRNSIGKGVDLGAGYGLFVRGMRDIGFDFYWRDQYCTNLLARGFETEFGEYDIAVAFEVLEHLPNPIEFLRTWRGRFQFHTCFFSALCFDEQKLPGTDWWYWAFEGGQHISFFSRRALLWMAEQLDMQLWDIKDDVYAFSNLEWKPPVDDRRVRLWRRVRNRVDRLLLPQRPSPRGSLTWSDHIQLRDKLRE